MKEYPSISRSTGQNFQEFDAYVFDKIDGSNLRFEWTRKQNWCKQGTRSRLFDETDEIFGPAIEVFQSTLSSDLEKIAHDQRWDKCIAFVEFWGANSFAGLHVSEDPKQLTLFDVAHDKKGLLSPREFLKLYGDVGLNVAPFLGTYKWTRGFVEEVRLGNIGGITFEGTVGKTGAGDERVMAKAKTQAWLDRVKERMGDQAQAVIDS